MTQNVQFIIGSQFFYVIHIEWWQTSKDKFVIANAIAHCEWALTVKSLGIPRLGTGSLLGTCHKQPDLMVMIKVWDHLQVRTGIRCVPILGTIVLVHVTEISANHHHDSPGVTGDEPRQGWALGDETLTNTVHALRSGRSQDHKLHFCFKEKIYSHNLGCQLGFSEIQTELTNCIFCLISPFCLILSN